MILKLKTAPTVEPLDLNEVMTHLRLDSFEEEVFLTNLIKTARQYTENLCGPLITQTWYQYEDAWPNGYDLIIGKPRLLTVTSVKHTSNASVTETFAATNYTVSIQSESKPRIVLKYNCSWPTTTLLNTNPIEIEFTCGYGTSSSSIPEPIRVAMLMLIAQWFENREPTVIGSGAIVGSIPYSVDALLGEYRAWSY